MCCINDHQTNAINVFMPAHSVQGIGVYPRVYFRSSSTYTVIFFVAIDLNQEEPINL